MSALIVIPDVVQHLKNCYELNHNDGVVLLLINDDSLNGFDVAEALISIVGISTQEALEVVLEAHTLGKGMIGDYPRQEAVEYQTQLALVGVTTEIV